MDFIFRNIKLGKDWCIVIALAVFSMIFIGYNLENSYFIPIILNNYNHNLYPNDLLVNSQSVLHSLFFPVTGYLLKFFSFKIIFNSLFFLTTFSIALLVFYLAMLLFKNKLTAYLSVFLLLIPKSGISLAPIGINYGCVEPSVLAKPFTLLAFYLFLKERYRLACLMIGLMFYLQGVEAVSISAMFLLYFLIKHKSIPRQKILHSVLLLSIPVLLKSLPLLSSGFFNTAPKEMLAQWIAIIRFRVFWHFFPFSWGIGDYFDYFTWILWSAIILKYASHSSKHEYVIAFVKAIIVLCFIGTVFVELIPIPTVVKLMPWRSTMFFVLFLVIYISDYLVNFPRKDLVSKLILAGTLAALFFSLQRLSFCFAVFHLALQMKKNRGLYFYLMLCGIAGIFVFTCVSFFPPAGSDFLLNKLSSFFKLDRLNMVLFYSLFLFMVCFLYLGAGANRFTKKQGIFLILFMFFLLGVKSVLPKDRIEELHKNDWEAVGLWARANTPVEAVFITPPYMDGFRINSQRGIIVEAKDGGIGAFDIPYAFKWWERMNDLGFNNLKTNILYYLPESRIGYNFLNVEKIEFLGKKYNADYLVRETGKELDLKIVYQNNSFKVYFVNKVNSSIQEKG